MAQILKPNRLDNRGGSKKKTSIEILRNENKSLLTLSENLLKEFKKLMKKGNVNGAKLIFSRVEEVNSKRQSNINLILSL